MNVYEEAQRELDEEARRAAVEARKAYLRVRQNLSWWQRLFPYTVRIERRPY